MSVEVTRRGTRGASVPRFPAWLRPVYEALDGVAFALLGKGLRVQRRPVLRLETVGARTEAHRHTMVVWFPDREGSWLIVASLAGAARHPSWFHNIARRPDTVWIRFPGGDRIKVHPESLRGAEREEAWRRLVSLSPVFAKYQEHTDRVIPVLRLVREA